ncbi:CG42445 [Drosophila busckii]|uniref:CG42445 n=1 Tax=Drosophila busckii TaxID=30019 RepID=A0A0M4ECY7_DROBS|nr:uncharacterized protein LOC108598765 [Drosophila busckii]ALC43371.1 CG42445 [Drosophila busckii]
MDAWELLQQLYVNLVCMFKIYLKFVLLTIVIYFVAEWYITRYGVELEDQLDGRVDENQRPGSNSTLNKVFRFIVNFLIL